MSGASPTRSASRPIAAFDFDGTLLAGDTLLILHSLVRSSLGRLVDGLHLLPALLLWKSGLRSTAWFKQLFLQLLLTPAMQLSSPEQRNALLHHHLANSLWRNLRPEALTRLEWHRQQGHRIVIVSASPRCLLQSIADRLDVELIATETTDPRNGLAIHLRSPNCKGVEKIQRLEQWLQKPLADLELHAYGDSRGDRELLQSAAYPHWRSFTEANRPYPAAPKPERWLKVLAAILLFSALAGLLQLDLETKVNLINGLTRLPHWLPAIVSVLAISYGGRYWRFRLLLRAEGVGRFSFSEAWMWFKGFALTATPGKVGELSRVHLLNKSFGYPRASLLHTFFAERFCDVAAVVIWLGLLVPGQLQKQISPWSPYVMSATVLAFLVAGLLCIWLWRLRSLWHKYLPSPRLAWTILPACGISLGIWGLEAMLLWILVQAISPSVAVDVGQAISIYLLSGTAGMASLLPGGFGVNEAATTLLLHQCGVATSLALSIAILRRLLSVWLITGLATIASFKSIGGISDSV